MTASLVSMMQHVHFDIPNANLRTQLRLGELQVAGVASTHIPFLKTSDVLTLSQDRKPTVFHDDEKNDQNPDELRERCRMMSAIIIFGAS